MVAEEAGKLSGKRFTLYSEINCQLYTWIFQRSWQTARVLIAKTISDIVHTFLGPIGFEDDFFRLPYHCQNVVPASQRGRMHTIAIGLTKTELESVKYGSVQGKSSIPF